MPSTAEMKQYLGGQTFGKPCLPKVDLTGKVYIITGANTGLGFECAKQLAALHASTIILACRNLAKGEAAKEKILSDPAIQCQNTKIEVWHLDLSLHSSILSFAKIVNKDLPHLDGFIANAGIEPTSFSLIEGCESTISINVLSTFLCAMMVLPKLQASAKSLGKEGKTNLSFVGSMQQVFAPAEQLSPVLQGDDIWDVLSEEAEADMVGRYGLSKLMVQLLARELASRLPLPLSTSTIPTSFTTHSGAVIINTVNPGWCATGLSDKGMIAGLVFKLIGRTAEEGGRTLTHAVTAGEETHGKYLSECVVKNESEFARSEEGWEMGRVLWEALGERLEKFGGEWCMGGLR